MARVFYIGAPSQPQLPPDYTVEQLLRETGCNTGNLLIGHALKRQLRMEKVASDIALDPAYVRENFDYVVIGAANMLYKAFDFTAYADFLEAVRLPCVIVGLGAQAPDFSHHIVVPKGTERMVKIISERSKTLGVRGNFTAETLARMGVHNVRPIGCPSMYWSCRPEMTLRARVDASRLAVALNGSANVVDHAADAGAAQQLEAALGRLSHDRGYPYVLQNERHLMEIVAGAVMPNTGFIPRLKAMYGVDHLSPGEFVQFVQRNMKAYPDVESWRAEMARFDFVLGTRFHGCLIALLAGTPCHVFAHDARTLEMCELLQIPHRDIRRSVDLDLRALYESLDLGALIAAYRRQYQNYVDFLDENQLDHVLKREVS
jgi:Polysaccharide pyruvyl transferase